MTFLPCGNKCFFIDEMLDQEIDVLWESGIDQAGLFWQLRGDGQLVVKNIAAVWENENDEYDEEVLEEQDMELDDDDFVDDSLAVARYAD